MTLASERQVAAADPRRSTWLTANAGSGKTRVLTNRVARLLFDGVNPQSILCLTYTKAAAGEMQNRLFQTLGGWAMLEDAALETELRGLGLTEAFSADRLARARRLFASAIETPGGLKIQTIHSFCGSLLRRFPMEAGVSPEFRELDENGETQMRADLLDQMAQGPDAGLVARVMAWDTSSDPDGLTAAVVRNTALFLRETEEAQMAEAVGHDLSFSLSDAVAELSGPGFDRDMGALIAALESGSANDQKRAAKLKLSLSAPRDEGWVAVLAHGVLNQDGSAPKSPMTKGTRERHPEDAAYLADLTEALLGVIQQKQALTAYQRTRALYDFARVYVQRVRDHKETRALLSFDDLIQRARGLLSRADVAQWVLWRLDGGLDHILVDEAQDTSPEQWAIVRHLTEQFGVGDGARADVRRTVFVVGDRKQSIYSFQGADPDEFERMRAHFEALGGEPLQVASLEHSFRSSRAILDLVDRVFDGENRDGLGGTVSHLAFFDELPGRVDLWPTIETEEPDEAIDDWTLPTDRLRPRDAVFRQAEQVAQRIKQMVTRESLPTKDGSRPIHEGDIMVLLRSRSALFHAILRQCKAAGLRMAGADRINLMEELAVRDILALLGFLSLPDDDLALATALRSPLFGWSERDLYRLAQPRPKGMPLWQALRQNRAEYEETVSGLDDLRAQVEFLRPYELISRLLERHRGRQKLLERLGSEAEEGIDALLVQALAYEQTEVPSLTGFLGWMGRSSVEIKRQSEGKGTALRVMTVHGSKGLEAPIVILPDCGDHRAKPAPDQLISGEVVVWRPGKDDCPEAVLELMDNAQAAEDRESRRLLYVAMTRAENWLIVGGTGAIKPGSRSCYAMVAAGMGGAPQIEDMGQQVQRVAFGTWPSDHTEGASAAASLPPMPDLPPLPSPPPRLPVVSPSQLPGAKALPGEVAADADPDRPLARGTALHLLLEHLPDHPPDRWDHIAPRLLRDDPEAPELIRIAQEVLTDPEIGPLFRRGLREVSVSAQIGSDRLDGTIDLLLVEPDRVLAIDIKTNRIVPDTDAQVPAGLMAQMGAYAEALTQIYPGRAVEVAILWTQTRRLMPLDSTRVREALRVARALDVKQVDP